MDVFVEQLIRRKKTAKDYLKIIFSLLGIVLLSFAMMAGMTIPAVGFLVFAICAFGIYLLYLVISSANLEYEYSFTNGLLDVDKIINAKRRKQVLSVNVRKMELMGDRHNPQFRKYLEDRSWKKVDASIHPRTENLCFLLFFDETGAGKMLLFNPNDKIKEGIHRFNPQKVSLNDENRN